MAESPLFVRPCFQQDMEMVQLIYAHHVVTGTGTFEIQPPTVEEMTDRWSQVVSLGWPYLVVCPRADATRVLGFAYAVQFRPRMAYELTFEDSVYVAPGSERQGAGAAVLTGVLHALKEMGVREVAAIIGDSANVASINLHAKLGFRHVGTFTNFGCKFGRWLDVVAMQRSLVNAAFA